MVASLESGHVSAADKPKPYALIFGTIFGFGRDLKQILVDLPELLPMTKGPEERRKALEADAGIQGRRQDFRDDLRKALEESKWNVSGAARVLGMERTNLHKRIRALGLNREK